MSVAVWALPARLVFLQTRMECRLTVRLPDRRTRIVALRSFGDRRVTAAGRKMETVLARAHKAGVNDPVVVYVPRAGQNTIYPSHAQVPR